MSKKLPKAIYGSPHSPLSIGAFEIPCYVLEDNRRVLVQRGMIRALGMSRGSSAGSSGDRLAKFTLGKSLKPYVSNDLIAVTQEPIKFKAPNGSIAYGYEAIVLADICDAVLAAREGGDLQTQQKHIAKQCEILVRAFARVGIIALVDEVTGYQEIRDRLALRAFLDKFITDEWARWTQTFPDDFYKNLFRLKGIPYPPKGMNRPSYVGHWTNDIVYSRLAPGVLKELRNKNPRQDSTGERRRRHHQHLTRDYGHPVLKEHLSNVIFLMNGCTSWDDFKRRLNRAKQKYGDTLEMDLDDDPRTRT